MSGQPTENNDNQYVPSEPTVFDVPVHIVVEKQQQQQPQDDENEQDQQQMADMNDQTPSFNELNQRFYLRYYVGHESNDYGHEFMEFELLGNGLLRYANNSHYKGDICLRKEVKLGKEFFEWIRNHVIDSGIANCDDNTWPEDNKIGRQEFEFRIDGMHWYFVTCKIGSRAELLSHNADPSLEIFYNLAHELKQWFLDTMTLHFRLGDL